MAYLPTWSRVPVRVKLLRPGCLPPKYMTAGAAGADVFADVKHIYVEEAVRHNLPVPSRDDLSDDSAWVIRGGETIIIPLGFAIEIPTGFVGVLKGRSGHATRGSEGHVAFIDSDYRGPVGMILHGGREGACIRHGERIGQIAIMPCFRPVADEFEIVDELSETSRGQGGFGSSGR
jgi:dUTP pyrophosphatase